MCKERVKDMECVNGINTFIYDWFFVATLEDILQEWEMIMKQLSSRLYLTLF